MKRISLFSVTLMSFIVLSITVQAAPMYYTFEGEVTLIEYEYLGIFSNAGLSVGSTVSYTFLFDFEASGYHTLNDGTVQTHIDSSRYDYFYTDYMYGDAVWPVDGGKYNGPRDVAEYNYGELDGVINATYIWGNSMDDTLGLWSTSLASDWKLGDSMDDLMNEVYNSETYSRLHAAVSLIRISTTPVPEPSTLLLLGTGLIGLAGIGRRFKV